jgi:hypothetical protein
MGGFLVVRSTLTGAPPPLWGKRPTRRIRDADHVSATPFAQRRPLFEPTNFYEARDGFAGMLRTCAYEHRPRTGRSFVAHAHPRET